MSVSNCSFGLLVPGYGSAVYAQNGLMFISAFNVLWVVGGGEEYFILPEEVRTIYSRRGGSTGVSCEGGVFYEYVGGRLIKVDPDSFDLWGNGVCGDLYRETEVCEDGEIKYRFTSRDGAIIADFSQKKLKFGGVWNGRYVFFQPDRGILSSGGDGSWESVYTPKMSVVKYLRCFGSAVIVFGLSASGAAACEFFDLNSLSAGCFEFNIYSGAVAEIYGSEDGRWLFLWGRALFRFDGEQVVNVLPGRVVGGYYVLASKKVCVLFSDENLLRVYDEEFREVLEERLAPVGYVFDYFQGDQERLIGTMHLPQRPGGLQYAVSISTNRPGCPDVRLECPVYKVERRLREKSFDVLINFPAEVGFPKLLRQALAALAEAYSQYSKVSENSDAAYFSGLVELIFGGPLLAEEQAILDVNCKRVSQLSGCRSLATGEVFNFRRASVSGLHQ